MSASPASTFTSAVLTAPSPPLLVALLLLGGCGLGSRQQRRHSRQAQGPGSRTGPDHQGSHRGWLDAASQQAEQRRKEAEAANR